MKKFFTRFAPLIGFSVWLILAVPSTQGQPAAQSKELEKGVFSALINIARYGVFDFISFQMDGNNVNLLGQVMFPVVKVEAEKAVATVPGIGKITNKIEVLPFSMSDDKIRILAYREIFSAIGLYRYALSPFPSLHIIVKDGHLTLEGVVSSEEDRNLAIMSARGLEGVFSVKNNLKVEKSK